ncbi:hypothetical protein NLJ89_g11809 [Agrocybe chaxingu]|uniref:Uncharacterized protein n=1 Tax=Agrocybe chaxingu TaxID=84603 RepID=A0A9W8JRP6_9AGAR|nr:hypothetical protein NLJ89_g11809 [Agrocybe chaxingu]
MSRTPMPATTDLTPATSAMADDVPPVRSVVPVCTNPITALAFDLADLTAAAPPGLPLVASFAPPEKSALEIGLSVDGRGKKH